MKSFFTCLFIFFGVLVFAQSTEKTKTLCTTTFYSLEYALEKADEITRLDLSNQNLTELPASIGDLKNLEVLKLSDNPLTKLPAELGKLKKLKTLHLQNIEIENVNETFSVLSQLKNLEHLDLDGNFLVFLPTSIKELKQLKYLDLSHTNLETLGNGLWALDSLATLDLSNNNLRIIAQKINQMQHLENVDLSHNPNLELLNCFRTIATIPNLKTLTAKGLPYLPSGINYFSQVEQLNFSNSTLKILPQQVDQLKALKKLTLDDCTSLDLAEVFALFKVLDSLETLSITHQYIETLPKGIAQLKNLKNLSIGGGDLEVLSSDFKNLGKLTQLSITGSPQANWQNILSSISTLEQLKKVNLSSNAVTTLPDDLGKLKYIKELDLSFNDLETLPNSIQQLQQLEVLQLFGNEFSIETIQQIQMWLPNCHIAHNVPQKLVAHQKEIAPPLEAVQITTEQFTINAEKPKTIDLASGSKIIIPENAFLDANGKLITGDVEITYREFNNPTDIFLSGIPMTIESEGKIETFQSAGMMEFRAYQNGTEVFPNPDNLIQVEVITNQTNDNFDVYDWNETTNEWVTDESQQDQILEIDSSLLNPIVGNPFSIPFPTYPPVYEAIVNVETKSSRYSIIKPKKRSKKQKLYISFYNLKDKISRDDKKRYRAIKYFPETKNLKKYDWIYDGDERATIIKELEMTVQAAHKNNHISDETYERWGVNYAEFKQRKAQDMFLTPNPKEDNYNLNIVRVSDTLIVPIYPNVRTNNPIYEQRRNEKIFNTYSSAHKKRSKDWEDFEKKYGIAIKEYEVAYENYRQQLELYWANRRKTAAIEAKVRRKIGLNQFGIKNIDVILKKRGEQLLADFRDENKAIIKPKMVYILDKSNNTVLTSYNNALFYDSKATMKIVALFDDNTIGIVEPTAFNQARKRKQGKVAILFPKVIKIDDYNPNKLKTLLKS